MSEEEQVVGVLKRCPVCDEKTLHKDGVCQEHKVIRRKKRKPAPPRAAAPPPPPPPVAPPQSRIFGRLVSLIVLGGLVYLFGAVHVLHGDRTGLRVCWKDGWTLSHTLIDSDDKTADKATLATIARCE